MSGDGILVSRAVYDGLEFVRQSGLTNMFDRGMVCALLRQHGFYQAEEWVRDDSARYANHVFHGLVPIDDMLSLEDERVEAQTELEVTLNINGKKRTMKLEGDIKDVEMMLNTLKATYKSALTYRVVYMDSAYSGSYTDVDIQMD